MFVYGIKKLLVFGIDVMTRAIPVFEFDAARDAQVGSGIGIGGGAMNGLVCFDGDDLARLHSERPDQQLILIRPDTVPDDIGMIFECDGLLTARGGATCGRLQT